MLKSFENIWFKTNVYDLYSFGNVSFYNDRIEFIEKSRVETINMPLGRLNHEIRPSKNGYFLYVTLDSKHLFSLNDISREYAEEIIEIINKKTNNLVDKRNIGINGLANQDEKGSMIESFRNVGFRFSFRESYKNGTVTFYDNRIEFLTKDKVNNTKTINISIERLKLELNSNYFGYYITAKSDYKDLVTIELKSQEYAEEIIENINKRKDYLFGIRNDDKQVS